MTTSRQSAIVFRDYLGATDATTRALELLLQWNHGSKKTAEPASEPNDRNDGAIEKHRGGESCRAATR
jgi:hypothetical protein